MILELPGWNPAYNETIWILCLFLLGYSVYYFFAQSQYWQQRLESGEAERGRHVIWSRYLGGWTIGVIPMVILSLLLDKDWTDYGLIARLDASSLWWTLGLAAVLVPMNYFNTQKATHLASYPTARWSLWSRADMGNYALSWVWYLFGYELMFRGLLLFGLLPVFGVWPTIVLNVVLYVLVHHPKSMAESIGALPLGLLLCLITLQTGTIWGAVLVHIVLALSNFFFALKHHPEMEVK